MYCLIHSLYPSDATWWQTGQVNIGLGNGLLPGMSGSGRATMWQVLIPSFNPIVRVFSAQIATILNNMLSKI